MNKVERNRIFKVQGRAAVSTDPDLIVLSFGVEGRDASYSGAIEDLNHQVEALRRDLETIGIERKLIKTEDFSVRPDYDYVKGEQVLRGYVAVHSLTLKLPLDQDLLNRALAEVANSTGKPTVSMSFDVSDKESLQQRLLQAAVTNARRNAETLAAATSVELGAIISIEYAAVEVRVRSRPILYDSSAIMAEKAAPDIVPSTLDAEDTVTILWAIS